MRNECDPALAVLSEFVDDKNKWMQLSSVLGLGLAYAGSGREDLMDILSPVLESPDTPIEVFGLTCLSLGMVFAGSSNGELALIIVDALMRRDEAAVKSTYCRFACLGLGLLYFGKQEEVEVSFSRSEHFRSLS